jgi:hypothetical protein
MSLISKFDLDFDEIIKVEEQINSEYSNDLTSGGEWVFRSDKLRKKVNLLRAEIFANLNHSHNSSNVKYLITHLSERFSKDLQIIEAHSKI